MSHDPRPSQRTRSQRPPAPGAAPLRPLVAALLACAAVLVLFVAGAAASRFGKKPAAATAADAPSTAGPTTKPPPGIGDPARDGKFEFVVTRVDCSRTSLGVEHLKRTAKGRFCIVTLSVRDIGDGSQYFLGHAQKALDAAGAAYGNDEIAGLYVNRDNQTFLRRLTPGDRVTGQLVFDIPKAARLTSLELHDSLLSGGVKVALK